SEVWIADLEDPEAAPRSVTGRLTGARTALVEHAGDRLLVLHESAEHGRTVLGEAEVGTTGGLPEAPVLLSAAGGEHFESVEAFADVVALQVRSGGVPRLRLIPRRADGSLDTAPSGPARRSRSRRDDSLHAGTPLEHDLDTGRSAELLREDDTGLAPGQYVERRPWAPAADGTRVPISVPARHDVPLDGTA